MDDLDRVISIKRTGNEPFCDGDRPLEFNLLNFWHWGFSNIVDNTTRGIIAEYLVAQAIGCTEKVREEWAAYDLIDLHGITIEVKSTAYLQSWAQKRLTPIQFVCAKTYAWDPQTHQQYPEKQRQAQVYVFAILAHQCKSSLNPLDVSQWQFYVVPTIKLDQRERSQHSITLPSLRALAGDPVAYHGLVDAIAEAASFQKANGVMNADFSRIESEKITGADF